MQTLSCVPVYLGSHHKQGEGRDLYMKFEKCSFNDIWNIHVNCDELRFALEGVEIAKEKELPTVSPFSFCSLYNLSAS